MKSNSDIGRMLCQDAENIPIDLEFKNDLKKRIMMQGKEKETVKAKKSRKLFYLRRASAAAVMAIVIGGVSMGINAKNIGISKNSQEKNYSLNETKKKDNNNVDVIDVHLKGDNIFPTKAQEEKVLAIEDNKSPKESTNTPTNKATDQNENSSNISSTSNDNSKSTKTELKNSSESENTVPEEKIVQNNIVTDLDKVYAVSGNDEASEASKIDKNSSNKVEETITKTLLQEENKIYIMDIKTKEKIQIDEGRKADLIENENYVAYIKDEISFEDNNLVTTSQSMNLQKNISSVWIYNVKTKQKQSIITSKKLEAMDLEKDLSGKSKIEGSKYTFSSLMWSKSAKQLFLLVNDKETNKDKLVRLQFK